MRIMANRLVNGLIQSLQVISKYLSKDSWQHDNDPHKVPAVIMEEKGLTMMDLDSDMYYRGKPVGINQKTIDGYKKLYETK